MRQQQHQVEEEEPKREPPKLGLVSLERIAAVFQRPRVQSLPEGVQEGSIEAMKYCGYLRSYDLDGDEEEDKSCNFDSKHKSRRHTHPVK